MRSIPEHDILDAKSLLLRATFAHVPRPDERRAAARDVLEALKEFHGLHGAEVTEVEAAVRVAIPGTHAVTVSWEEDGWFYLQSEEGWRLRPPLFYDAAFKMYVGPEVPGAVPGRNGVRPRVGALPALVRVLVQNAADVSPER
jgi:hypothetical protein